MNTMTGNGRQSQLPGPSGGCRQCSRVVRGITEHHHSGVMAGLVVRTRVGDLGADGSQLSEFIVLLDQVLEQ